MREIKAICGGVLLGVALVAAADAALLDLSGAASLSGSTNFETDGGALQADLQYAVFSPGTFFSPADDPSGGAEWVYAYEILVDSGVAGSVTVGLAPGSWANSVGTLGDGIEPGAEPDLLFVGADSVVASFFGGLDSNSHIYLYNSPSPWMFTPSSVTNAQTAAIDVQTAASPDPAPEPATVLLLGVAGVVLLLCRRSGRA